VIEQFPDKVKIVYKHFPLSSHQFAALAALASVAAQNQGKFWQYHDLIFKNYRELNPARFSEFAEKLGLNMPMFSKDMNSQAARERVTRDFQDGRAAGVNSTPTIFINGRLLRKRNIRAATEIINQELGGAK